MSKSQQLRVFINKRLTVAAEEIFEVFEKTLTEYASYDEEMSRCKWDRDQQRKVFSSPLKPVITLHRREVDIRLSAAIEEIFGVFKRIMEEYEKDDAKTHKTADVCEEEVPHKLQKQSPSLGQEEPEPLQIKEEQKELWTSQEGEQLQGLEEADIKSTFAPFTVKSENDEEKPQSSSQLDHTQAEKNGEAADPLPGTSTEQIKTEAASNVEPTSDIEPTSGSLSVDCSETETEDSERDWTGTREPQSSSNALKSQKTHNAKGQSLLVHNEFRSSMESSHELKSANEIPASPSCKVCGRAFPNNSLTRHVKIHSSECGLCGKHLEPTESLRRHLEAHRTCNVCGKTFTCIADQERHVRTHTGERPFGCSVCSKRFSHNGHLYRHLRSHSGDKPYSCTVCGKTFSESGSLKTHMRTHTGEKPYSCSGCGRSFSHLSNLRRHRCLTGE